MVGAWRFAGPIDGVFRKPDGSGKQTCREREHRSDLTGPCYAGGWTTLGAGGRMSQNGVGSAFLPSLNFDRERFAETAIEGARQGCVAIGPTLGYAEQCAAFRLARTASVRRTARGMQRGAPHAGGGCPVLSAQECRVRRWRRS